MGFLERSNREHTNIRPIDTKTNKCNGGELQIFTSNFLRNIVDKEEDGGKGTIERETKRQGTAGKKNKRTMSGKGKGRTGGGKKEKESGIQKRRKNTNDRVVYRK